MFTTWIWMSEKWNGTISCWNSSLDLKKWHFRWLRKADTSKQKLIWGISLFRFDSFFHRVAKINLTISCLYFCRLRGQLVPFQSLFASRSLFSFTSCSLGQISDKTFFSYDFLASRLFSITLDYSRLLSITLDYSRLVSRLLSVSFSITLDYSRLLSLTLDYSRLLSISVSSTLNYFWLVPPIFGWLPIIPGLLWSRASMNGAYF